MREHGERPDPSDGEQVQFQTAAGKRTLTSNLAVQREATGNDGSSRGLEQTEQVHATASEGIQSAGGKLPHHDLIQQSFGRHDISGVQAHSAPEANAVLGSKAYALGDHVAFGEAPSLHTEAHEAAHVIQQRRGVALKGGVGAAGDEYERHADAVADVVVAGRSAEALLGEVSDRGGGGAVQRQAVQFWGDEHLEFTGKAVDTWNERYPVGHKCHIDAGIKARIVSCSDDPDKSGRVLTGTVSDVIGIYGPFVGNAIFDTKAKRHAAYKKASDEDKKKMRDAADAQVVASEGPSHGEGNRPKYGSGGAGVNKAWVEGQIQAASQLSFFCFLSSAGAGQLGDAMHGAQDRASHWDGQLKKGHDDVRDKLGIDGYNTDDPSKNTEGKANATKYSLEVLERLKAVREY